MQQMAGVVPLHLRESARSAAGAEGHVPRYRVLDGVYRSVEVGMRDYQKNDGSTGTRLYVVAARSVQAIRDGDFTVPAKKLLAAPTTAQRFAAPESGTQGFGGFTMMDEDDGDQLPF